MTISRHLDLDRELVLTVLYFNLNVPVPRNDTGLGPLGNVEVERIVSACCM